MFKSNYANITQGNEDWRSLKAPAGKLYEWSDSTYIHNPPFFTDMKPEPALVKDIKNAYCY